MTSFNENETSTENGGSITPQAVRQLSKDNDRIGSSHALPCCATVRGFRLQHVRVRYLVVIY